MNEAAKHTISIVVSGKEVRGATSYAIETSMTSVGTFSLRFPFSREAWDLLKIDRPCQVLIDGIPIITGFIDDSDNPEGDPEAIEVSGRDRLGRLTQDCAPGINYSGLGMKDIVDKLAGTLFPKGVTYDNARNRRVTRGSGKKARSGSEPLKIRAPKKVGTVITPGQTRGQVIFDLCEQGGYLVWSSGDGRELIVGLPNYDQEIQYKFFRPKPGSARAGEATVRGMGIRRSVGDGFSRVICVGSGKGTDANYGARVASRYGEAKNNPATKHGEGLDFVVPKVLIIQRPVKSAAEAKQFAEEEMARRSGQAELIPVRAAGHGQVIAGSRTTLFTIDTMAALEDERTGTRGAWMIVSCKYSSDRNEAEGTTMELVPKETVISR